MKVSGGSVTRRCRRRGSRGGRWLPSLCPRRAARRGRGRVCRGLGGERVAAVQPIMAWGKYT